MNEIARHQHPRVGQMNSDAIAMENAFNGDMCVTLIMTALITPMNWYENFIVYCSDRFFLQNFFLFRDQNCQSQPTRPDIYNPPAYNNENSGRLSISQLNAVYTIPRDLDLGISCDSDESINDRVRVTWRKVNGNGFDSNVRQNGHGLLINDALMSNSGTYECTIEYNGRTARTRTNIVVTGENVYTESSPSE